MSDDIAFCKQFILTEKKYQAYASVKELTKVLTIVTFVRAAKS